jgi:hypothetical protein
MASTYPSSVDTFGLVPAAGKAVPYNDYAKLQDGLTAVETEALTSTSYTPTWTGSVSNPAIGNGTITGKWTRRGNLARVDIHVVMGSTTTYGSGIWEFTLPSTAIDTNGQVGSCLMKDTGTSYFIGVPLLSTTGKLMIAYTGANEVSATVPHTWANTDILRISLWYRLA